MLACRLHPQPTYRKQLQIDIGSSSSGVIGVDWSAAFLYFGLLRIDFIRTAFLFKDLITPHEADCIFKLSTYRLGMGLKMNI